MNWHTPTGFSVQLKLNYKYEPDEENNWVIKLSTQVYFIFIRKFMSKLRVEFKRSQMIEMYQWKQKWVKSSADQSFD